MSSEMRCSELVKLARTTRLADDDTGRAIFNFFKSLDCPRSLTCWLLYSSNEHDQLASLDCPPDEYLDYESFRDAFHATSFLSKADFLQTTFDRDERAISKFREFETHCGAVNRRFENLALDRSYSGPNVSLLSAMIRKIDSVLFPFTAEEFVDAADWGPGATTRISGSNTSAFNKFRQETGITRDLYRLVSPWFSMAYPLWTLDATGASPLDSLDSFEVGNRVVTVPKNSKTNRVIAIEPGLNIWFQKAIGKMIRRRLFRVGIDLNTQERNQQLAQKGLSLGLCTVDFSSASDSISKKLVRTLIRDSRWLSLLESSRSRYGSIDGSIFKWNKFSSMGNGYTFELESLIFYAAAVAVCEAMGQDTHNISVFGDDVIIPTQCFDLFSSFCSFLGFFVNKQKSFSSGYFRESCGSYFYDGRDCKPIFLKKKVTNVFSLYKLANSVRLLAHRRNNYSSCDARFFHCWRWLVRRAPKPLRLRCTPSLGDVGFHLNFDEATPTVKYHEGVRRAGRGFEGYRVTVLTQRGVNLSGDGQAILLARLWGSPKGSSIPVALRKLSDLSYGNEFTLRNKVKITCSRDILVSQWYDFGSWLAS